MNFIPLPWHMLLLIVAGWMNRQQQNAIEYLINHGLNWTLREGLERHRLREPEPQMCMIRSHDLG